jgi:hypothetical protein
MVNKKNWLGMLVVVLAFGIIVVSFNDCSKNADTRLNGTWKGEDSIEKNNSGYYEISEEDGTLSEQGTYTTDDGKLTSTPSHHFGTQYGLDSRWYSKDELRKELGNDFESDLFDASTIEYIVDGNKLIYIYDEGETYILTLVSRNGKFTKATSSGKNSESVIKSSGSASALAGRWSLTEGPRRNNPEEMELLKNGTGIVDGSGVSWKIENGRFYLIHPLMAFSSIYNASGSALTLTKDDGVVLKYKKK